MFFVALAKKVKFSFQKRHNEIDHQFLFLRLGLGDHHRQCDERMVGDALRAVFAEKQLVALQEIEEQSGGDSLVAIREAVVLRHEIQQVRRLLLRRRIEVLPAK